MTDAYIQQQAWDALQLKKVHVYQYFKFARLRLFTTYRRIIPATVYLSTIDWMALTLREQMEHISLSAIKKLAADKSWRTKP